MNKIIELLIDIEGVDFSDLGVDIMSLVAEPAIGVTWQKFAAEKFVDVKPGESEEEYVSRCIPVLIGEGFDQDQAAAICYGSYEEFLPENPCQSGYVAYGTKIKDGKEVPNCIPIENSEFESYTDYPEAAKNNAKRAIEWADENGWGDCGTNVGKMRANQLAKGEPISEDTIARMASFRRHQQNSDTPYSEGCGKLMWDSWGGEAGIAWAERKLKSIREEMAAEEISEAHLDYIEELINREDFGTTFDPATTSYVNLSKEKFETEEEVIQAIGALNDLLNQDGEGLTRRLYRYTAGRSLPSGSESRRFCRIMMSRPNQYYTEEEIDAISNARLQPGMGPGGTNFYDVFKYKGGVNCRHRFVAYNQYESNGRTVVSEIGPVGESGEIASSSNDYWRMSATKRWAFTNDDEQIVVGPAMLPNLMIPRRDPQGNMYHVYFSEETVRKIAKKFLEENKQHNTDIDHDDNITTENTLLESWIVEDPEMDKAKALGFDVPKGAWMVSYKINNDETWQKIKDGELNGYSIAGQFVENYAK